MNPDSLPSYKKSRTTIKTQFTKLTNKVNKEQIDCDEIDERLEQLESTWNKFLVFQEYIEQLTNEDSLEEEINYRTNVEDLYFQLRAKLRKLKPILSNNTNINSDNTTNSNTSNISFVPFCEDETFDNFTKRLEVFMFLKNISDKTTKAFTLLNALSPCIHQKLYNICAPDDPLKKSYEELISLLKQHLDPQPSVWARQHNFIIREQMPGESISDFSMELKKLVARGEFDCSCGKSTADTMLRLQFIRGLRDSEIRTTLLQTDSDKTFNEVINYARVIELSKTENQMMSKQLPSLQLNQIAHKPKIQCYNKQYYSKPSTNGSFQSSDNKQYDSKYNTKVPFHLNNLKGKCYRCGDEKHKANSCRYVDNICKNCKKVGHLARVCLGISTPKQSNRTYQAELEVQGEEPYEINVISNKLNDKFNLTILIDGKERVMELDTGAALSSMSYADYLKLQLNKTIQKTGIELRTYTGEIIKPKGFVFVECFYRNKSFIGKLYIIDQNVDPIFGRDWIREIQLDFADIKSIQKYDKNFNVDKLMENYKDVFDLKIGIIPDMKGHIQLVDGAQPTFIKPRQVPYALVPKVEAELDRLEKTGIITKIEQCDWGTPIVPVVKPSGQVRICADFKATLNKQIKDVRYPIPKIEDMFSKMNNGKFFCTLDIYNAYLHMSMDEESSLLQTISTHKGQYKVNRLMFGIKIAPAMWQRFMDQILQGIDGVQCFFDDIIIQGSTKEETLQRLEEVLKIMRKNNLTLNQEKCKFFQSSINYLGHTIDENGLHKNKDKVDAILKTKQPSNVAELRTFLGIANYYHKFIPNINSILNPLYYLLRNNVRFVWTADCERSFNRIKTEIASDSVLVHFNPKETLVLATDASPVGVGAVLSHRFKDGSEKPIAFASRSLTLSEKKYSQIDKEALAIYWGLKKFYQYCYGRKFVLITDHKPLISIFDPYRTLPTMTATRIFNYAHFLSGFNYTIEYKNTKEHSNADYVSRFPVENPPTNIIDQHEVFHIRQIETMPVTHDMIAHETKNDNHLNKLRNALLNGDDLALLGLQNNEYSLQDGCLFRGSRVLIPESLQGQVLKELHSGHIGIVKMKYLARSFCYWPNIDKNIEDMAKSCQSCCLKQNLPPKTVVHPWLDPSGPWQRLHIDFAGPMNGQYFFIIVDAYTKWVEVIPTKTITSSWCIQKLRHLFATFGYPITLVSDNATNFTSLDFNTFMKVCGITHKFAAPYHPATNGQAERFVQTTKKLLQAMNGEGGDVYFKISQLVMALRNTPNSTGHTAYELMFGRQIRTRLDLMKASDTKTQEKTRPNAIKNRELKVGDRVQIRNFNDRYIKWKFGSVDSRDGLLHYNVKMDNGQMWRRHVNHIRTCQFEGEDC